MLKSNIENGIFELSYGTAESSRMAKRQGTTALQQGYSQREISQVLQVDLATVNRDISYLRNQAKKQYQNY